MASDICKLQQSFVRDRERERERELSEGDSQTGVYPQPFYNYYNLIW